MMLIQYFYKFNNHIHTYTWSCRGIFITCSLFLSYSVVVAGKILLMDYTLLIIIYYCRAFSVVESLESRLAIQNGEPVNEFSVQQLISCDYNPSESLFGCQGGALFSAFISIVVWMDGWTKIDECNINNDTHVISYFRIRWPLYHLVYIHLLVVMDRLNHVNKTCKTFNYDISISYTFFH